MIWVPPVSLGGGEALAIKLLWLTQKGYFQLIRDLDIHYYVSFTWQICKMFEFLHAGTCYAKFVVPL